MIYAVEAMADDGAAFAGEAFAALRAMEVEAAGGRDVYPYTREVLSALRREGMRIGVSSRNCTAALMTVFPDAGKYVDAVVTRDNVRDVKPKPAHVEAALRLWPFARPTPCSSGTTLRTCSRAGRLACALSGCWPEGPQDRTSRARGRTMWSPI